jgi:hypothetical protein
LACALMVVDREKKTSSYFGLPFGLAVLRDRMTGAFHRMMRLRVSTTASTNMQESQEMLVHSDLGEQGINIGMSFEWSMLKRVGQ